MKLKARQLITIMLISFPSFLNAQEDHLIVDKLGISLITLNDSCYCFGRIVNQKREGDWVYYSTKLNAIYQIAYFENDTLNGHAFCIRSDGTIKMDLCYKYGHLNGWSTFYNKKCEIVGRIFYINSIGTYWDQMVVDEDGPPLNRMYVPKCECSN